MNNCTPPLTIDGDCGDGNGDHDGDVDKSDEKRG